jgi:hypothetical protein
MLNKEWKVTLVSLCGLGACVAGFGGLALRLSPQAPAAPRAIVPAVADAEEDECEEAPALPDAVDAEA